MTNNQRQSVDLDSATPGHKSTSQHPHTAIAAARQSKNREAATTNAGAEIMPKRKDAGRKRNLTMLALVSKQHTWQNVKNCSRLQKKNNVQETALPEQGKSTPAYDDNKVKVQQTAQQQQQTTQQRQPTVQAHADKDNTDTKELFNAPKPLAEWTSNHTITTAALGNASFPMKANKSGCKPAQHKKAYAVHEQPWQLQRPQLVVDEAEDATSL